MSEISRKVIPYEYNYLCNACNSGMMQINGKKTAAGYPHSCLICGAEAFLKKSYPHVEYFAVGETPS